MKKILVFASVLAALAAVISCQKGQITIKAVTGDATDITESSAYISGQVVLLEGTASDIEFGVLYSISKDVLYDTAHKAQATDFSDDYEYNLHIIDLKPATTYYYRSYVYQNGAVASYGIIKSFITAPESVDLGLSVKWAVCNLGADSPEDYGLFFAWGDVAGQTWNGSSWSEGGFSSNPSYELDENGNLNPEYDAAQVLFRGSCRMPTKVELQELIDNCISTWTNNYNGTGVAGRIFASKKAGYIGKSIFLPATGCGIGNSLYNAGADGFYWSSSVSNSDYSAQSIRFVSGDVYMSDEGRSNGYPVRPVCE